MDYEANGSMGQFPAPRRVRLAEELTTIGAFRDHGTRVDLPPALETLRTADVDPKDFRLGPGHHLNHGAFGSAFGVCSDLAANLRLLSEENPNRFYDYLCLPLVRESRAMAEEVFGGECELFPNVTLALKAIAQAHRSQGVTRCAYLPPLYGSTVTMLRQVFPDVEQIEFGNACAISDGCSSASLAAALTEDGATITKALSAAHAEAPFSLLFADQVSSLSGRILDTEAVISWCRENGVACILDGTQSADFNLSIWPETYVVGSQKWLCNVKTCAIVRTDEGALPPNPCAFSFGYPSDAHLWSGCLDYVPFIVLQKALRIHQAHGEALRESAATLLRENLPRVGRSALPPGKARTMELVPVHRFEEDPQATINAAGVYASVKRT